MLNEHFLSFGWKQWVDCRQQNVGSRTSAAERRQQLEVTVAPAGAVMQASWPFNYHAPTSLETPYLIRCWSKECQKNPRKFKICIIMHKICILCIFLKMPKIHFSGHFRLFWAFLIFSPNIFQGCYVRYFSAKSALRAFNLWGALECVKSALYLLCFHKIWIFIW